MQDIEENATLEYDIYNEENFTQGNNLAGIGEDGGGGG